MTPRKLSDFKLGDWIEIWDEGEWVPCWCGPVDPVTGKPTITFLRKAYTPYPAETRARRCKQLPPPALR